MRLIKLHKEDIWNSVRVKAIVPKEDALKAQSRAMFDTLHKHLMSKESFQLWKQTPPRNQITKSIVIEDPSLGRIYSSAQYPAWHSGGYNTHSYVQYAELTDELKKMAKAYYAAEAETKKFIEQLYEITWNMLNSVTTVKKLKELWPEGISIIDKAIGLSPTQHYPAVLNIDLINKMIPLP